MNAFAKFRCKIAALDLIISHMTDDEIKQMLVRLMEEPDVMATDAIRKLREVLQARNLL